MVIVCLPALVVNAKQVLYIKGWLNLLSEANSLEEWLKNWLNKE